MPTKWYLPQDRRDAVDCIEQVQSVVSFINESIAFSQEEEYHLSGAAAAGLCNVLTFIEGALEDCNKKLLSDSSKTKKVVTKRDHLQEANHANQ